MITCQDCNLSPPSSLYYFHPEAALLADSKYTSDHSMSSSFEGAGGSAGQSFAESSESSSINRAAELDRMVEAGDWEGVVLTAAQFEGSRSSLDDSVSSRTDKTDDSKSKLRKAELREEVEQLVRKVVPDEMGKKPRGDGSLSSSFLTFLSRCR